MIKSRNVISQNLSTAAESYSALGWSVIPTHGKVASLPWAAYQQRRASLEQLQQWFLNGDYSALAIITGKISQLCVLDFDNFTLYERFQKVLPFLIDTLTTQSRRGFHVYLQTSPNSSLRSMKLSGLDVQYDGRYVIASPSIVDGHEYTVVKLRMPHVLTPGEETALKAFLATLLAEGCITGAGGADRFTNPPGASQNHSGSSSTFATPPGELIAHYRQKAHEIGRNQALFQISLLARDHGYSCDQTIAILTEAHVVQPANGAHRYQTPRQRKREAEATIRSAYKRPARPQTTASRQLPNVVREALMHRKATYVIRVLDGLRQTGVHPGQTFSEREAMERFGGMIGRHSLQQTLWMQLEDGEPLLERVTSHSTPQQPIATEKEANKLTTNALLGGKNSTKIQRGRKPTLYIMPDDAELAERLRVKYRAISDELPMEALQSARRTRMTLHAKFIERKPGQYNMRFFAQRLGKTRRTIQNYHALMPEIKREAVFLRQPISWHNLNEIPDELPHRGFFLTDSAGKRYPAKVGVAKRLLGVKKLQLTLNRQLPNLYWCGDGQAPVQLTVSKDRLDQHYEAHRQKQRQWVAERLERLKAIPVTSAQPPSAPSMPPPGKSPSPALPQMKPPRKRKVSGKRRLSDPDQEATAHHLVQVINEMTSDREGKVTLLRARRLVARYGRAQVLHVLWRVARRQHVRKPIGLLCTLLRSEQRFPR